MSETLEDQKKNRILYIILCDARNLISRISGRRDEYISIFALKRTREHFEAIFKNKYDQITPELLTLCPEEVIEVYFRFHNQVERLKWYLIYTDDMPNSIDESISREIHSAEVIHKELVRLIEKEIFGYEESSDNDPSLSVIGEEEMEIEPEIFPDEVMPMPKPLPPVPSDKPENDSDLDLEFE